MDNLGLPPLVLPTFVGLSLIAAVLAGYSMSAGRRHTLHKLAFAASISFSLYVIMDLNLPRAGLIRVNRIYQLFRDLHDSFATSPSTPQPEVSP